MNYKYKTKPLKSTLCNNLLSKFGLTILCLDSNINILAYLYCRKRNIFNRIMYVVNFFAWTNLLKCLIEHNIMTYPSRRIYDYCDITIITILIRLFTNNLFSILDDQNSRECIFPFLELLVIFERILLL